VLLHRIEAERFLSFGELMSFDIEVGLNVVTGLNGAGKSNLGRCLELGRAVIGQAGDDPSWSRLALYDSAGYQGAESFTVRLSLELDQPSERELVWAFVCAAFAFGGSPRTMENWQSAVMTNSRSERQGHGGEGPSGLHRN
jgi:hypothetical protein